MRDNLLYPRVGMGLDFHRIKKCEPATIRICGVEIDSDFIIEAHSDGDVGLHALTDAMLGAIANGNIGTHFSNQDPRWKDVASSVFVDHANQLVKESGGIIINIDITIICEAPKIMVHSSKMQNHIAQLLSIKQSQISIKATTTEKMGFLGQGEGIGATAVCCIATSIL